jgi:DNA-directed RNA polymerase subunit RPC12/RpoP
MKTLLYRACPRCHGDLVLDAEEGQRPGQDGLEYVCLQCGRRTTMKVEGAAQAKEVARTAG